MALVTGASRGIGRAIAQRFAVQGARVAVHYRSNRPAAEATLASLAGAGHFALGADLADPAQAERLVEETVARAGGLHVLVNNAGVYAPAPPLGTAYEDWLRNWSETIGANLHGPANVTYWAVQHMAAHGGGRIVNVSSRGAFRGEPEAPAYGASKAGLNSFGQSLAKALAPAGIFVGTVAPGFVETDMAESFLAGSAGDEVRSQSPLNRVARPEEVAQVVCFLASPGTEFTTGCIVDVNGASYLRT